VTSIPSKKKAKKGIYAVRIQYAALPYRFNETDELEILLVTTRRTRRWIIPKGWPIKGLKPPESAAREAFEEAGVRGKIGKKSVGTFTYQKLLDDDGVTVPCEVKVFPLLVQRQSETWPEIEQRLARWLAPEKAISLIKDLDLKDVVEAFVTKLDSANAHAPSSSDGTRQQHPKSRT
jgi:8-oxo-dGTP pyrophosphatase MutT (NUDIX family)